MRCDMRQIDSKFRPAGCKSLLSGCTPMTDRFEFRFFGILFVLAGLFCCPAIRAQDNADEPKGIEYGGYNVQQSVELGYRGTWINGNTDTYDTFVDLRDGPRLLDYTLNMRSLSPGSSFFDDLNFSNFGYGGDPNDVSRLRIEKRKLYEFSALFRRNETFWDYNLLANPLNPVPIGNANPAFAVTRSPHSLNLVRRMGDYDLTLFPQAAVRFRLGYSRDVEEGPSLTTYHGTTDFLLAQNFRMTTNAYHAGVDFQVLPRTTISYDQFLEWNKNDTNDTLAGTPFMVQTGQFPGTTGVDLGVDWYFPPSATTTPCASPFPAGYPGYASPTCKEYSSFAMSGPTRIFMPTERVSFQSMYFARLEMSGAVSYSGSNDKVTNVNSANEWTNSATSQIRNAIVAGPALATQVSVHANWSGIYSLTSKIRILDSVNYDNWRNPGLFNQLSTNLFATAPQTAGQTGILLPIASFSPLATGAPTFQSVCPSPFTATTCPQHSATSSPDFSVTAYPDFIGQRLLSNTVQVATDFTRRISGRIGYRYENRNIGEFESAGNAVASIYYPGGGGNAGNYYFAARGSCAIVAPATTLPAGCVANADGSITYTAPAAAASTRAISTINEQVILAGVTLRPKDALQIDTDFEFGYSDYAYTRIWPRQIQGYKVHASYSPRTWATIDGAIDIHENRDNVTQVDNLEHGRTYSFSAVLAPRPNFSYSLGYNYTDLYMQTFICFRDTFGTMTGGGLPTFPACPIANSPSSIPLSTMAFYSDKQHYAYSDVMWKPMKRVTAIVGYSGTFAGGNTVFLNPLQPAGTLAFNYQRPYGSLRVDLYKGLSWKAAWEYEGYNAKAPFSTSVPITGGTLALAPLAMPDFNGSAATFSVRYAF
jgi:hypothetical protein